MIRFFSKEEEDAIVEAIRKAELATSGEIRVHIEVGAEVAAISVAKRVFHQLGMNKTADRNGVLILLEVDRREFAIIGDEGIDKVVPAGFWDSTRNIMQLHFRQGEFARGIELAIGEVGIQLKAYFPYQTDDVNELPDEISYGG